MTFVQQLLLDNPAITPWSPVRIAGPGGGRPAGHDGAGAGSITRRHLVLSAGPGGGRPAGHDGAGAGSITRRPLCCQLAQEAGGPLAMTEQERAR